MKRKKTWLTLLVLAGFAGLGWWQSTPMLARYHVKQLACACPEDREGCAERVAELGDIVVPYLLDGMRNADAAACANLQYPFLLMVKKWGVGDPRSEQMVERISRHFAEFSSAGQEKTILLLTNVLQQGGPRPLPPRLTKAVGEMLLAAEKGAELRSASLLLAAELIECVEPGQWVDACRAMAERGFQDGATGPRVAALQLLMREPMRKDKDLLEKTIPLLTDRDAAVRKAVLLLLAKERDLVREESFLPLLHDDDAEVRYLCEMALRKRGLRDDDIEIARMISDPSPATRMRVLYRLQRMPDANLVEWLRRLSLDPAPAVRAAAARAVGENPHVDLSARLRAMATEDPSETVRQNALFYLQQRTTRGTLD
jgi:hypothetical protein